MKKIKDGFHKLTEEEYRKLPFANYSAVKVLCLGGTPAHYKAKQEGNDRDTAPKSFGRLVHQAVLEPDCFKNIEKLPDNIKRRAGKDWEDLQAAFPEKTFLPASEWKKFQADRDIALRVRDQIIDHPVAGQLLNNVRTEIPMIWTHEKTKVRCKGKMDILAEDLSYIADIKTTSKIMPYQILRSGYYFGYHIQVAMYCDGLAKLTKRAGQDIPFWFIFVETEPPYLVSVADGKAAYSEGWDESQPLQYYKFGKEQYEDALRIIADCQAKGEWEGHQFEPFEMILPKFAGMEGVYV